MEPIHVAVIVIGILLGLSTLAAIVFSRRSETDDMGFGAALVAAALLVIFLIVGWMALGPEYRLWRASIEKRIAVEEARATADSAIELARAEVERAKGTAEANHIVAESITERYLRYLYINQIGQTDNQIIYLPTEAGLPILEADRFNAGGDE